MIVPFNMVVIDFGMRNDLLKIRNVDSNFQHHLITYLIGSGIVPKQGKMSKDFRLSDVDIDDL